MKLPLVNSILTWVMKKRIHQMELFMKFPHDMQREWFRRLLDEAKDTEWGKKYEFKSIHNYKTFSERLPLQSYEDARVYFDRIRKGEKNILWPTEIKWFAKSSGTTSGKSKYIPVSEEAIHECHFKGGKDMLSLYCNNFDGGNIFEGKSLMLGGSHTINQLSESVQEGDLSAIIIENLPYWVQLQRSPNKETALLSEWEEKIYRMALQSSQEDITSLSGVPSWTLVLANKVLEITGKEHLQEVWPNLELYMHGGVSFSPYESSFRKLFPSSKLNYLEIYNASEGFFGIQDQPGRKDMLLMLDYGIFYEFIPIDEIHKEQPKIIDLSSVELNATYALVISTNAGLWRYKTGDTIIFTSTYPYRIRITGRTKHFINSFGEELMIGNAEEALEQTFKTCGGIIRDYTVAPLFMDKGKSGAHEWLIEFSEMPNSIEQFAKVLDNNLQSINSDYEAKRYKDMILSPIRLHVASEGLFYQWMKRKEKLGGQHKVPRLVNNRKYIEELLKLQHEMA